MASPGRRGSWICASFSASACRVILAARSNMRITSDSKTFWNAPMDLQASAQSTARASACAPWPLRATFSIRAELNRTGTTLRRITDKVADDRPADQQIRDPKMLSHRLVENALDDLIVVDTAKLLKHGLRMSMIPFKFGISS